MVVPGDGVKDFLTLVDADGASCTPKPFLFNTPSLRIMFMTSTGTRADRKWLVQDVRDSDAVFVMAPWWREELLTTS